MFIYAIPFIFVITLLFIYVSRQGSGKTVGAYGLWFYAICFGLTIYLHFTNPRYTVNNFPATIFLSVSITFWLLPLLEMKKTSKDSGERFIHIPDSHLKMIVVVVAILSSIATIYYLPQLNKLFSDTTLLEYRDINNDEIHEANTLLGTIMVQICSLLPIVMVLLGYCYTFKKVQPLWLFLLLFGSLCEPLHMLVFTGRDGFVQWLFLIVFTMAYYLPFMSPEQRLKFRSIAMLLGGFCVFIFMAISISRFQYIGGSFTGMLSYLGQMPRNFSHVFEVGDSFSLYPAGRLLPLLARFGIIPLNNFDYNGLVSHYITVYEYTPNVFSTFIGSACLALPAWVVIVLSAILGYCIKKIIIKGNRDCFSFSQSYLYIFYAYFLSINIFYARFSLAPQGNVLVILSIMFYYYMYNMENKIINESH